MVFLDFLIIFLSGYFSKTRLSIFNYILILTLLPLASIAIMIVEMKYVRFDFYGYIVVILLTGVSFLSVWVFPALNGESKKVELSMYFVIMVGSFPYIATFIISKTILKFKNYQKVSL